MQNVVQFEEKTGEIECKKFDEMMMMILGTAEIDAASNRLSATAVGNIRIHAPTK